MPVFMNSNGDTFNVIPYGNVSFINDTFDIDELMAPIINTLMNKGYTTRACCSGHITSAYCPNFDDCVEDPNVKYEVEKCTTIDRPYIMFEDNVEIPNMNELPDEWMWEYSIPASKYIITDSDNILRRECTFKPGEVVPVFSESKKGFNICIRPDPEFYGFHLDNLYDKCKDDPYQYYGKLVIAHHNLYMWAKKLPPVISKKPKHGNLIKLGNV